jgi:phosphate transport system permease protein
VQTTAPERRQITAVSRTSDKVFQGVVTSGALSAFVILALIAGFLFLRSSEVFRTFGLDFITSSKWDAGSVEDGRAPQFGVAAMLMGSIIVSTMAMIFALPFVMGTSLFLEFYISRRIRFVLV